MSKLVTIYGGSGFIGRYVARRMAKAGWRVRVAVRRPNEAIFVKPYGVVGQVEPVFCNIRDDASVRQSLRGADAVVNCVGILQESGRNRFDAVQTQALGVSRGWLLKLESRNGAYLGHGRGSEQPECLFPVKGGGRGGGFGAYAGRNDFAAVHRLWGRGSIFQPLCQHGALRSYFADRRC